MQKYKITRGSVVRHLKWGMIERILNINGQSVWCWSHLYTPTFSWSLLINSPPATSTSVPINQMDMKGRLRREMAATRMIHGSDKWKKNTRKREKLGRAREECLHVWPCFSVFVVPKQDQNAGPSLNFKGKIWVKVKVNKIVVRIRIRMWVYVMSPQVIKTSQGMFRYMVY